MTTTPTTSADTAPIQTFAEILRAYSDVTTVSLSAVLAGGDDPRSLVAYLDDLGITVTTLDDILKVNDIEDEEEIFSWKVLEGIAVSIASDGAWLLYVP